MRHKGHIDRRDHRGVYPWPRAALLALLALLALTGLLAASPAPASAVAPEPLWQRCADGTEDPACKGPRLRGVATSPISGHVYVTDTNNARIVEFTAWGEFVRAWGWGVEDGSTELQVCTEASACLAGSQGDGKGQFTNPQGLAVDGAGNLYVADAGELGERRVQKFDPAGNFLFMIGGDVNRTKVEGGAPEAQQNRCPVDPGDVCQAATQGAGKGQFGPFVVGSYIAAGNANVLFVGDQGRIQVFNPDGTHKAEFPDPEGLLAANTVTGLAKAPGGGLFASFASKEDVVRLTSAGAKQCTAKVKAPTALAADASGNLFVFDANDTAEIDPQVREFTAACLDKEEPFGQGEITSSTGIAAGQACLTKGADLYISNVAPGFLRAYGPLPDKLATCPKPVAPPRIADQYALSVGTAEATVRAEINPGFWETAYWVQYATAACIEAGGWGSPCVSQQPTAPGGAPLGFAGDGAAKTAAVLLHGLVPDTAYLFRFAAQSGGGGPLYGLGGTPGQDGAEAGFRTFAPAPQPPTACPNQALRLGLAALLPDCRAYEMVSPVDKDGSDIRSDKTLTYIPVARNQSDLAGDKLTFTAERRFGDAVSQPYAPQYIATRGAAGWSSHGISPPRGLFIDPSPAEGWENEFRAFSEDLCSAWLVNDNTTAPPLAAGGADVGLSLYQRSNCGPDADTYETVQAGNADPQGFSADAGQTIFIKAGMVYQTGSGEPVAVCLLPDLTLAQFGCSAGTKGSLTPGYDDTLSHAISEDGSRVFFSAGLGGGGRALFLRENPTEPQSALAHGAALGTGDLDAGSSEVTNLATTSGAFQAGQTIVARGIPLGTTIIATAPGVLVLSNPATEDRAASPLYPLRAHSECTEPAMACTVPVSESVSPGAFQAEFTTQRATFLAADPDGSQALFSFDPDKAQGGNGPARDELYRFDVATATPQLIAHDVIGVLGTSEDLARIYLVSTDVLSATPNSEGEEAGDGEPNLYVYDAAGGGSFGFVATLAAADARPVGNPDDRTPSPISVGPFEHSARVTPDGGAAAFTSTAPLTGYDNRDAGSGEALREVFLYSAVTDELSCVSCNPSGVRPEGGVIEIDPQQQYQYRVAAQIPGAQHSLYFPRALSENGSRLFFESFEPLVLRDVNGAQDVYQWEAAGEGDCTQAAGDYSATAEGCVSLISSGQNAEPSSFLDASPDGSNVFFTTAASLVGGDPGLIDIYDARVDGGLPPPQPLPPPCEGEACQSPPEAPNDPTPASSSFQGAGNVPEPPAKPSCKKGKVRRKGRCVKKHRRAGKRRQAKHTRQHRANADRRAAR